jgi:hypothetical protein
MSLTKAAVTLYTVYGMPSDFPHEFVCRRYDGRTAEPIDLGEPFARGRTLDEVRRALPAGLYNLGRQPFDDWAIVESWV